jgi:predicted RNase H-like HicB family nuclease
MQITLTGIFEKVGDWYIGYVEELPGANGQGRTLREVRSSLREAVKLILQSNRELAEKSIGAKDVIREKIRVAIG